jgi:hypothetical protein
MRATNNNSGVSMPLPMLCHVVIIALPSWDMAEEDATEAQDTALLLAMASMATDMSHVQMRILCGCTPSNLHREELGPPSVMSYDLLMDSMDWFVLLPPLLEGMVRSVSNDPMLLEAYLGHEYYQGRVELNRVDSIETSVTLIESHPAISMLDAHAEEESVALSVPQDEGISNTTRAQAPLIEDNSINRS